MTERELRKLSRTDLMELLLAQQKENERLRGELEEAQARLADRTIQINEAGSLAEASMRLSGVFEAAQDACQYYMENIRQISERQTVVCQQLEAETRERCDRMVAEAEQKSQQYWESCAVKIRKLVDTYAGLRQSMDALSSFSPNDPPVDGHQF